MGPACSACTTRDTENEMTTVSRILFKVSSEQQSWSVRDWEVNVDASYTRILQISGLVCKQVTVFGLVLAQVAGLQKFRKKVRANRQSGGIIRLGSNRLLWRKLALSGSKLLTLQSSGGGWLKHWFTELKQPRRGHRTLHRWENSQLDHQISSSGERVFD